MTRGLVSLWPFLSWIGRHIFAVVIAWVLALAFVQIAYRLLGGGLASEAGQLMACALSVAISLRIGVPIAAYFLGAMAAFIASELLIHLYYGIRAAQGAPTHFAVMGAGILGVAIGALLARRDGRPSEVRAVVIDEDASHAERPQRSSAQRRRNVALQRPSGVVAIG